MTTIRKRRLASMWTDVLEAGEGPLECVGGTAMSQYFCEVCDKDLKTEENMKQHFKEHIPCAFPGCKFNAHFLVSHSLHNQ